MSDLIRRDDAIRELNGVCSTWEDDAKVQEIIMAIPSTKPTGDLISRADAIEAVTAIFTTDGCIYKSLSDIYTHGYIVEALKALPSAEAIDMNESCEKCEHHLKGANEVPCCYCTIGKSFYTPTDATCATCADRALCIMSAPDGKWKACKDYRPSAEAEQVTGKLIDGLEMLRFFNQRAGRELWQTKPREIQNTDIKDADEILSKAISALSAEAVQGEWIMHGEPPWYVRECSECGTKWHQWSGDSNPNYCGHCGARMIGGDNE